MVLDRIAVPAQSRPSVFLHPHQPTAFPNSAPSAKALYAVSRRQQLVLYVWWCFHRPLSHHFNGNVVLNLSRELTE